MGCSKRYAAHCCLVHCRGWADVGLHLSFPVLFTHLWGRHDDSPDKGQVELQEDLELPKDPMLVSGGGIELLDLKPGISLSKLCDGVAWILPCFISYGYRTCQRDPDDWTPWVNYPYPMTVSYWKIVPHLRGFLELLGGGSFRGSHTSLLLLTLHTCFVPHATCCGTPMPTRLSVSWYWSPRMHGGTMGILRPWPN